MGNYNLKIPEKLHNELRHKSIDEKKDISDLIIEGIEMRLKKK